MGYSYGVPAYSSDYESITADHNIDSWENFHEGEFTGAKWQCVEYARRWLILNYQISFRSIPMAFNIFGLEHGFSIKNKEPINFIKCENGSNILPFIGSMLIWSGWLRGTGHVAIITKVTDNYVEIAEQNWDDKAWHLNCDFSRRLPVTFDKNRGMTIEDKHVTGWINYELPYNS